MLPHEGGYANDPADPGGETKFGISKRTYPNLDIKHLTESDAQSIYQRDFWEPYPYKLLNSQDVANKVFDLAVNMGHHRAGEILQQACIDCGHPVVVDGKIGKITIAAANSILPLSLLEGIKERAKDHYRNIAIANPALGKFLKGWLIRANA